MQADVTGLCWVRYTGPISSSLEAPRDDPVLKTYAQLLSEGSVYSMYEQPHQYLFVGTPPTVCVCVIHMYMCVGLMALLLSLSLSLQLCLCMAATVSLD